MFTNDDKKIINDIAYQLTRNEFNEIHQEIIFQSFSNRIKETNCEDLYEYLEFANNNESEIEFLISSLTIHFTSWFREPNVLNEVANIITNLAESGVQKNYKFLCIGCSSGEEVYTFAAILECIKNKFNNFDYQIEGWDIDAISLKKANQAKYLTKDLGKDFPFKYLHFLTEDYNFNNIYFSISKNILKHCTFRQMNIFNYNDTNKEEYDFISCRNLLIYFEQKKAHKVIELIHNIMNNNSHFISGVSETHLINKKIFQYISNGIYKKQNIVAKEKIFSLIENTSFKPEVICIGGSTGGTEVLVHILQNIPKPCPPIFIVQHFLSHFSKDFAEKMKDISGLELAEMLPNSPLKQNTLYISQGNYHIGAKKTNNIICLKIEASDPIQSQRPSIDFMFSSIARAEIKAIAILLTGMGKDGANGLVELKQHGSLTIVQDKESSCVFGMPKEAIQLNAAKYIYNPKQIRECLEQILKNY